MYASNNPKQVRRHKIPKLGDTMKIFRYRKGYWCKCPICGTMVDWWSSHYCKHLIELDTIRSYSLMGEHIEKYVFVFHNFTVNEIRSRK